jgi:hypothetical protein
MTVQCAQCTFDAASSCCAELVQVVVVGLFIVIACVSTSILDQ